MTKTECFLRFLQVEGQLSPDSPAGFQAKTCEFLHASVCYVWTLKYQHVFVQGKLGHVFGDGWRRQASIFSSSTSPFPLNSGVWKAFNFLEKQCFSEPESLSCTVSSCIFNTRKQIGQNSANWKRTHESSSPSVLLGFFFNNPHNTFCSLTHNPAIKCEKHYNEEHEETHRGNKHREGESDYTQHPLFIGNTQR